MLNPDETCADHDLEVDPPEFWSQQWFWSRVIDQVDDR